MTCADVRARFFDAADGRLDAASEMRLHDHLQHCAGCRDRAALWDGLLPGLRAIAPPPPDAMQARRLQIEVERRLLLASGAAPSRLTRRPRGSVPLALGLVAAGVVLAAGLHFAPRWRPSAGAARGYATVTRVGGEVTVNGHAAAPAVPLGAGSQLSLAASADAELALGPGTTLRLRGPGRLVLAGSAHDVVLRLEAGRLDAAVAHRAAGETFAVTTSDARVEVRGTRFSVGVAAGASWVSVDEGRVEVQFSDGRRRSVSAGESAASEPAAGGLGAGEAPGARAAEPAAEVPAAGPIEAAGRGAGTTCAGATRACLAVAREAREDMRAGAFDRALRLVAAGAREAALEEREACAESFTACADELRYLRAEALRAAGRLDAAAEAYKALDRRGAPGATRQNALYAAAQLELRQGHVGRARADFERALAAAPRGALHEEALVGAMESAAAASDAGGARALARRYLAEFPAGLATEAARRLAGGGGERP